MFCWIQCFECLSITCGVIRLLFGGVGWQGKRSLSACFFFCTTCNLWLTSASSALLLTALFHCFKHIKQCCWSFSRLVTNPHYLFPCIYALFCFVFLHPLASMTFSYSKGQHSFMLVCFGMEVEPRCV